MDENKFSEKDFFSKKRTGLTLRLSDLARLSVRVFRVRPTRTFLTILGFSVGIGMVLFLVALGYGLQFILIGNLATTEDSLVSLEAFYPSESDLFITNADEETILKLENVAEISFIAEMPAEIQIEELSGFLNASIINENFFRLSGTKPNIGETFEENPNGVIISSTALLLFGMEVDETILNKKISFDIFYPEDDGSVKVVPSDKEIPIIGIITDEFNPPFIYIPAHLVSEPVPFYQRMFIKASGIDTVEPLRDSLIEMGFIIAAKIDLVNQANKIMTAITTVLGVFGATALFVSSVGMFNTMTIGFLERIFEVGIMKSIGASANNIRNIFLSEAFMMGLAGGVGGIMLGFGAGEIFNFGLNILAGQLGGESVSLFIYPMDFLLFILAMSIFVGLFSGFWPARRASKLSPKEAFERK